ncbi:hypothetical protein QAD02_001478 [Eretmocerus hayati]|uniref:Uncharacterized protein n=1 Tax=Eretmocerus hayati TaxID=131215 RepID=A0ACC2NIQ9_9HYME|nr:hypothetical protein QAD02_001478 [Eretmocerus hayati]
MFDKEFVLLDESVGPKCTRYPTVTINPKYACLGTNLYTLDNQDTSEIGRRVVNNARITRATVVHEQETEHVAFDLVGAENMTNGTVYGSSPWTAFETSIYFKYLAMNVPVAFDLRVTRDLCEKLTRYLPYDRYFVSSQPAKGVNVDSYDEDDNVPNEYYGFDTSTPSAGLPVFE